jgi:hypothetical protein
MLGGFKIERKIKSARGNRERGATRLETGARIADARRRPRSMLMAEFVGS